MKRKRSESQIEEEMVHAQRKLLVVIATMSAVLLLAILIARLSWSLQARKQHRTRTSPTSLPDDITSVEDAGIESDATVPSDVQIQSLLDIAKRRHDSKNYEEAAAAYRKAIALNGQDVSVWVSMGRSYLASGDTTAAKDAFEQALELDSHHAEAQEEMAVVYMQQQKLTDALAILENLLIQGEERPRVYLLRAICQKSQSNWADATESLQDYLAIEPGEPFALKELAFIEASQGQYESALRHLKQALETAPEWPGLHLDAAATCALMENSEEALRYLRTALDLSTPGVVYRVYRQPAFQAIRRSEAGEAFEQELAQKARERLKGSQPSKPAHTFPLSEQSVDLVPP